MNNQACILIISVLLPGFLSWPGQAFAAAIKKQINRGNSLYAQHDYSKALEEYSKALLSDGASSAANYNAGAASYKLGDYPSAKGYFERAVNSKNNTLAQMAFYNLANAEYCLGMSQQEKDFRVAAGLLEDAARHYEHAIVMDDKDEDARYNYELVKAELEKLKKKLQRQDDRNGGKTPECPDGGGAEQEGTAGRDGDKTGNEDTECHAQEEDSRPGCADGSDEGHNGELGQDEAVGQGEETRSGQEDTAASVPVGAADAAGGLSRDNQALDGRQDISRVSAQVLLDNYSRREQPKGMYSEKLQTQKNTPVDKDW
ncbi:MAG: tetratricopeptide repeat protein [Candidatus Omnitrophota bacterium]